MDVLKNFHLTLRMIQFEHSVFALPFALIGALVAARGWPTAHQLLWIVVAMVGARSAAMAFNRIADRTYDARNARTQMRELPAGKLSVRFAALFTALSGLVFLFAASQLNRLSFWLSPGVLLILLGYSFTKRFTVLSHFYLGLCLGLSPVGAWIAIRGTVDWEPWLLCAAVLCWTAGFDILYACQDVEFDRQVGLFSIPRAFGIKNALRVSSWLHVLMIALLLLFAWKFQLGAMSYAGIAVVAALLIYDHRIVSPDDLSRVNVAFFAINGYVSLLLLLAIGLDVLWRKALP